MRVIDLCLALGLTLQVCASADINWTELKGIEKQDGGYATTGEDPWLFSAPFSPPPKDHHFLLVRMQTSGPIHVELRWLNDQKNFDKRCTLTFRINQVNTPVLKVLDLDKFGGFRSLDRFRLDPGNHPGVRFQLLSLDFVPRDKIPAEHLSDLLAFRGYTSKLHYLPGELIEYKAVLLAKYYPDRTSAKLLTLRILDDKGKVMATHRQQYGLPGIYRIKELHGTLKPGKDLNPGRYRLEAVSRDLKNGFTLGATHDFGVLSGHDPYIYETPFKFVKDFSIIRDQTGLWHIFSITGDFFEGHDWQPDGNERTFSHGTSRDLRHWKHHPPVLSISDASYPDGKGKFEDRNVWAPHVVHHDGTYYMFYTSVNKHVSQSISLATSKDLFQWKKHPRNPVVTLEDAQWARWTRTGWADARDPAILKDGGRFYLYFTAHARDGGGAVGVCKSTDLIHWTTPGLALRGRHAMESPQVWKQGGRYFMTTSAAGSGVWESNKPDAGWRQVDFPRPPVQAWDRYVKTSASYAEEVAPLDGKSKVMAGLTFRYWGNSIYISRIIADKAGKPIGYESPFALPSWPSH